MAGGAIFIAIMVFLFTRNWPELEREGWFRRRGKVKNQPGPSPRSFSGRAGRREWMLSITWNYFLVVIMVQAAPHVGALLCLPWLIAGLAVTSRRLHDMEKPIWLMLAPLIAFAVVVAMWLAKFTATVDWLVIPLQPLQSELPELALPIAFCVCAAVMAISAVLLAIIPGTDGPTIYGEADIKPPKPQRIRSRHRGW